MEEEKAANSAAFAGRWDENFDWETSVGQPKLLKSLNTLAWLGRYRPDGLEYWKSMELMGRGVSASHDIIQQSVLNYPGAVSVLTLENLLALYGKCSVGMRR